MPYRMDKQDACYAAKLCIGQDFTVVISIPIQKGVFQLQYCIPKMTKQVSSLDSFGPDKFRG